MQEEIFGPVLTATTFRTPKEAISLANNSRYGLAASIWSENINLCLGLAPYIKAGVIWINGTNMFDASAAFGGMRESGIGREGGWEGLSSYTFFGSHSKKKLKAVKANKAANKKITTDIATINTFVTTATPQLITLFSITKTNTDSRFLHHHRGWVRRKDGTSSKNFSFY